MKTDRILSVLMLLLNCEMTSAPELSKIFGVSAKTIHRDVEIISKSGIPLVTAVGPRGGIGIPEDFKAKKNISGDMSTALIALTDEYPGLLDSNDYILSKHRRAKRGRAEHKALIRVTLRFDKAHKDELEREYDMKIDAVDGDSYTAHVYIGADKGEYDKLFSLGDKCECVDPRHVRNYIIGRAKDVIKNYGG